MTLIDRYRRIRARSCEIALPLSEADCQVQSMPDASPIKWHLAHVTWFFETFVLEPFEPGFRPHHPAFRVLFNSYYNGVGEQHPRAQRGLITRPGLAEVLAWRVAVDQRMEALLAAPADAALAALIELGLQHEQQHQELMLTDLLHLLACNPLAPVYRPRPASAGGAPLAMSWVAPPLPGTAGSAGGLVEIGHAGAGFAFDNEAPRHRQFLRPYALANRLVTQGEWSEFMADGGYRDPRWWLSAGWDWVRANRVEAPLYWRREDAQSARWQSFTLHGTSPIVAQAPVVHISCFEADAFARWWSEQHLAAGHGPARLPTETEWEHAAAPLAPAAVANGHLADASSGVLCPLPATAGGSGLQQMYGDVWEWTGSAYTAYPGFRAPPGAIGEYNAKFMVNQIVLRGGSCATPREHIRASYRNFFPADARWQFNGLRLACDLLG